MRLYRCQLNDQSQIHQNWVPVGALKSKSTLKRVNSISGVVGALEPMTRASEKLTIPLIYRLGPSYSFNLVPVLVDYNLT
jgi:hypothetical protein